MDIYRKKMTIFLRRRKKHFYGCFVSPKHHTGLLDSVLEGGRLLRVARSILVQNTLNLWCCTALIAPRGATSIRRWFFNAINACTTPWLRPLWARQGQCILDGESESTTMWPEEMKRFVWVWMWLPSLPSPRCGTSSVNISAPRTFSICVMSTLYPGWTTGTPTSLMECSGGCRWKYHQNFVIWKRSTWIFGINFVWCIT